MAKELRGFLNFVNNSLIHAYDRKDGKGQVVNVSIPCTQSVTGYGSITVNAGQVLPATKKDGTVNASYSNIALGKNLDRELKVSITTKKATAKKAAEYDTIKMTVKDIVESFNAARAAYRAAAKEQAEA